MRLRPDPLVAAAAPYLSDLAGVRCAPAPLWDDAGVSATAFANLPAGLLPHPVGSSRPRQSERDLGECRMCVKAGLLHYPLCPHGARSRGLVLARIARPAAGQRREWTVGKGAPRAVAPAGAYRVWYAGV